MLRRLLHGGQAGEAREAGARRIAANAGLQLTMRVLQMASGILTLPLLARTLGPEQFGTWAAALGYVGLFASFTEFGLTNAAMLKMAGDPEHESQWLAALSSLRTLFAAVLTVVCALGVPLLLSDAHHLHQVAWVLTLMIPAAGAASLMAVFQSRLRGGVPLAITVLQTVLWLATVVVLATRGAGVLTVAIAYTALLMVMALVQVQTARRLAQLRLRGARRRWRELLGLALPIGVGGLLGTIYYKLDAVLVFELAGAEQAGIYGAAYRFLDPLVFLPAAIVSAFVPVFAATHGSDPDRMRRLVQRCAELLAVLAVPAVAVSVVLSPQVVQLLFGADYAASASVLPVLMIAFASICFGNLGGYLAPVVGMRWRIAQIALVGAVVNVTLNFVFVPEHGALAAAWATVVTEILTMSMLMTFALRRLGVRPSLRRPAGAVAAGVVMTGVLALTEPLGLVPALLAGGLAYGAAVLGLRVIDVAELRSLRA